MTGIEYDDFLDREYNPDSTDLVCTFRIDPAEDMSMEAAASRVASESSNGTWAALHVDEDELTHLGAVAYGIDGDEITVAYPAELFEAGSMPQILSCIAGNIMGMKAVDAIRLEDCKWPESITSGFPGPQFGTSVAREKLDAGDRPILATVPKPKVGLSTDAHVRVGEEAWRGGVDLLKDDENLTDQDFNPFEDRLAESLAARDRVEEDVGERKDYLVNVTAETNEMLERVDLVDEHGGGFVMVDIITCGWSAVQSVRDRCEKHGLAIHAHRAMHAAFDRMDHHGVSMRVIAQISRLCGVDHIHTGTAGLGKLANEDTPGINDWLHGNCHGLNPVLPVASGGLHPGVVDQLIDALGTDICVQAGGGIHGHPDGTHAGAKALRQATDASLDGVPLEEYAQDPAHAELATALKKWGAETPR
ncbi:ribulose-bisphosphate carboxylase [Natrialba magadii ATCC 43099]|uniref:Ribulose bisphosphate carboxylase n=1 Tax=Natrialba magadii (strain ATCC 43099 / DSM 3394 / CCM 3739 / CIP 104546 / IAM 13178 / JCM 8861 / NBRC 102185 / NCIMB 2190 / MS3) TaxID=547559 RepID=D3SZI3_NATMM|nr:type III ribulose-bisphosphate carboxylase [Natrialba magadii]ADD04317.1 ribulose-bisphosphate carboxylase [Natrialba magadii ATCC 43099]ELY26719.1 ribulose bisophosphate carboxylase [Natrialba magadii ATCC 43099]